METADDTYTSSNRRAHLQQSLIPHLRTWGELIWDETAGASAGGGVSQVMVYKNKFAVWFTAVGM